MEQFVLGIFQEQLSKFIVGFRKEQVNANLLNGKGEIRDVELNCDVLNETAAKVSPLVQLESVHVSKVSFYVSSWTNIRKAPILIDIEHVSAQLVEPFAFLEKAQGRKEAQQITKQELVHLIQQGILKTRGAYNLFDRILDNLTVEVSSVQISFQPSGKFKTRRPGPWTPPSIQVYFANIRFASVNEYGQEAPPEEIWRHNNHHRRSQSGTLLIYKKCEMEYRIAIQPVDHIRIPLVTGNANKAELQVAIERRIRDGEVLSVQMDITIPSVECDLSQEAVPHVAHAMAGVTYLLAKDREFQDPLREVGKSHSGLPKQRKSSAPIVTTLDSFGHVIDEKTAKDTGQLTHNPQERTSIEVNIEDEGSSSSSEEEEEPTTLLAPTDDSSHGVTKPYLLQQQQPNLKTDARYALPSSIKDQPVIVLPNGIVIHERISLSVSIYDAVIRGIYGPEAFSKDTNNDSTPGSAASSWSSSQYGSRANGSFELVSKGCIVEAIWPKTTKEKGGYIQASCSYFTLEEKHDKLIKTLVSGGVEFRSHDTPLEKAPKPLSDVGRDETFPLYEDRVVRPDPLGLRHSFPAQAFGLKTTIDFSPSNAQTTQGETETIQVLHEVGVDQIDLVLDTQSWCRILSFLVNEQGGGFDPRWHSGNWSNKLKPTMLVNPNVPLNLDDCLQPTKQIFLDENEFISSDLLNMTARVTRVKTTVPANIHEDVKSCSIVVTLDEAMLLVSSALPRTMLSGRIGNSVNGDAKEKKGIIEFPNDVTDVAYALENSEDPSNRQRGIATSHAISTFRAQITLRGCSVRLEPAIDFYACHYEPLLAPCEVTLIFCFEGEPPQTPDANVTQLVLFLSLLVHRYEVNVDLDLLAAAVSTVLFHSDTLKKRVQVLTDIVQRSTREVVDEQECSESLISISESVASSFESLDESMIHNSSSNRRIPKSLRGRRVLVQQQLHQSRESGGVSVAVGIQIGEFRSRLWRQHVLVSDGRVVSAVNLLDCCVRDLELGLEASLKAQSARRIVLKGCLSSIDVKACDFAQLQQILESKTSVVGVEQSNKTNEPNKNKHEEPDIAPSEYLVDLVNLRDRFKDNTRTADYAFGFRLEEVLEDHRRWSISSDLANTSTFHFRPEILETLVVQIFEALLMQYDPSPPDYLKSGSTVFPEGTVGAVLLVVVPSNDDITPRILDWQQLVTSPELSSDAIAPGEQIDVLLQMILDAFVPETVDVILFRSCVENVVVALYCQGDTAPSSTYKFTFHSADFVVTYFVKEGKPSDDRILTTVARKDETWASLVGEDYKKGLCHRLTSRQSVSSQDGTNGASKERYFVAPFNLSYSYAKSKARLAMDKGLEIGVVEKFDDFVRNIRDFTLRFEQMVGNMKMITTSVQSNRTKATSRNDAEDELASKADAQSPIEVACSKTAGSIQVVREFVNGIQELLHTHGNSVGSLFLKMQNYMDLLRFEAFRKEKDRLAAMAVASSQATGWLRMGAPGRTGQRGTLTATLWPYWAVLRKGMILVYGGPGKTQVLDIITLQGAALYQLGGGQRKRDLKRAFGLLQSRGMLHLVTVGTDREYHQWIREMNRSILAYGAVGPPVTPRFLPTAFVAPSVQDRENDAMATQSEGPYGQPSTVQPQSQGRVRNSLARAVQAAKATKQAVANRGTFRGNDLEIEETEESGFPTDALSALAALSPTVSTEFSTADSSDDLSRASSEAPTGRGRFRNRLAGVSKVAKSKLGDAVQKAREKAAERRQQVRPKMDGLPEVSENSGGDNTEWQCPRCTYLNLPSSDKCQMCDCEKEPQAQTREIVRNLSSDDLSATGSDLSDVRKGDASIHTAMSEDGCESIDGTRQGMRSRLGAAVRMARGAVRTKPPTAAETAASPDGTLKMRDVVLTEPLDTSKDAFGDFINYQEEILKRLDGNWFVRVKVVGQSTDFGFPVNAETTPSPIENTTTITDNLESPSSAKESESAMHVKPVDTNHLNGPVTPSGQPSLPKNEHTLLQIHIFREQSPSTSTSPYAQVIREFSDVFSLHTTISECVGRLAPPASHRTTTMEPRDDKGKLGKSLAKALGLTALDAVRTTATLLAGLLDDGIVSGGTIQLTEYHADVIAEFLNSMIDTELPIDGLLALIEFLELTGISTRMIPEEETTPRRDYRSELEREFQAIRSTLANTYKLGQVCQSALIRAEGNSLMSERIAKTKLNIAESSTGEPTKSRYLHVPTPVLSSRLHNAVHDALMKVMEERDQARASYLAANVLHVHELEQERKKNKRLEQELAARRLPEEAKEREAWRQFQAANNDDELMSLCQQLSSEIGARTTATLEVARLKEIRETERSNDAMEKEALQEEIRILRQQLERERNATATARHTSTSWRHSFENAFVDFEKDPLSRSASLGPQSRSSSL